MNCITRSLTVILSVSILSTFAFAYSGGDGTPNSPYQIADVNDFMQLSNTPGDWNKAFVLMADINLSGITFTQAPIAPDTDSSSEGFNGTYFTGILDGNGRTISNLTVVASTKDFLGLFGSIGAYAEVKKMSLTNINIQGRNSVGGLAGMNIGSVSQICSTGEVEGVNYVGGLIGQNLSNKFGIITNCYSTGTVNGNDSVGGLVGSNSGLLSRVDNCYAEGIISGNINVGGLVGNNDGAIKSCYSTSSIIGPGVANGGLVGSNNMGTITNCYATGAVNGSSSVGGLVGQNSNRFRSGRITNCYATGAVAVTGSGSLVGGLLGQNTGLITNCYATGDVTVTGSGSFVGGLLGQNTGSGSTINCYATGAIVVIGGGDSIGGLMGQNSSATITSCFWDIETSGKSIGVGIGATTGVTGKTTAQMQTISTFTSAGWDFEPTWVDGDPTDWTVLSESSDYPKLSWQITSVYSGGNGTAENPYQIATAEDMKTLSNTPLHWSRCFVLMSDIDISEIHFVSAPIGSYTGLSITGLSMSNTPFTGVFDGNGHIISNLTITASTKDYIGLFGSIGSGGHIKNLGVENANIKGSSFVGGLAGNNNGVITSCYATGVVNGYSSVGGVVEGSCIGGLVGRNESGMIISCYATDTVDGISFVGGLVGKNFTEFQPIGDNTVGTITNCYATGAVSGSSYVGGLVGQNYGIITSCFWDTQTTGQAINSDYDGAGKTTAEMMMRSTFTDAGWDFVGETANGTEDIWYIREGQDYPRLVWENTSPVANAGQDQTVYAWIDGKASVTLNGSDSNDVDGDALTFSWMLDGAVVASDCNAVITLPVGVHTLSLTVSDGVAESSDDVIITVIAAQQSKLMLVPKVINRKNQMPHIMALFQLPEGVNKLDGKVALYPGGVECTMQRFLRIGGRTTVFVWFDKDAVMQANAGNGMTELTIVGKQLDGPYVYGMDKVLIMKNPQPDKENNGKSGK